MCSVGIAVEGKSDRKFLEKLLDDLAFNQNDVRFYHIGNKSNFFKPDYKRHTELKEDIEFEEIKKVLFVIDADNKRDNQRYGGYENTQNELEKLISALGLETYIDTFISCDPNTKEGYLESLILSSLDEDKRQCIQHFLDCSQFKSKENEKTIVNQIYSMGYPNAPYNFQHKNFDKLKQKLKNLFS